MTIDIKESVYDFPIETIDGKKTTLGIYRGKLLLIVNVASKCGFTKQYKELEKLYRDYKNHGLVVLGFPCNQFGNQEPGTAAEIKEFCTTHYSISFPLFAKTDVNGLNAHPLFTFLKQQMNNISGIKDIEWNFTKLLINTDGKFLKYYSPSIEPEEIAQDLSINFA